MRLSHHLTLIGNTWYFRLTTPRDLRLIFGTRYLKHSLKTSQAAQAKALAYALGAAYLTEFSRLRGTSMADPKEADRLKKAHGWLDRAFSPDRQKQTVDLPDGSTLDLDNPDLKKYELEALRDKQGQVEWGVSKTDGTQADAEAGQQEAARRNKKGLVPYLQGQASGQVLQSTVKPVKLSAAIDWFYDKHAGGKEAAGKSQKTVEKYRKIQREFMAFLNGDPIVAEIGSDRIDDYRVHLVTKLKNEPTTIRNKLSALQVLFDDLIAANRYKGVNPAEGHITVTTEQKRRRSLKRGRVAFDDKLIKKRGGPANSDSGIGDVLL